MVTASLTYQFQWLVSIPEIDQVVIDFRIVRVWPRLWSTFVNL